MTARHEIPARTLQLLDAVSVSLGVEVARVSLRLSDLMDLMPGTKLDLPMQRSGTVMLLLGDAPIAEARVLADGESYFLEIIDVINAEETLASSGR